MQILKFFPLVFLFMEACIDPLKVTQLNTYPQLVVDGIITNGPGPYQVKLFYSTTDLETTLRRPKYESGALVRIISDANESEPLLEVENGSGVYQTISPDFQGHLGTSYKLQISTGDGREYVTDFQKLYPPGNIDSVFVSFEPKALSDGHSPELKDAFKILINAKGNGNQANLFRWRWKSVYKGKTFPELHTIPIAGSDKLKPDPLPCSGYTLGPGLTLRKVGECTCCICWSTRYSTQVVISENKYILNNQYNNVNIGEFIINSMLFYDHLYIEVEQLSLSEDVYNFWKLTETQQKAAGNLFQPNSIRIHGNVHSLSNPSEEVLGIFAVSAIQKKEILLNKSSVPYELPPIDTLAFECTSAFLNATTEKPPFW